MSEQIINAQLIGPERPSTTAEELYAEAIAVVPKAEQALFNMLERHIAVDEVAILFPGGIGMMEFIKYAIAEHGWALTNTAVDQVSCSPIASDYTVEYLFLTNPSPSITYRIEIMRFLTGFSPLHFAAVQKTDGGPVVIHASWKPEHLDDVDASDQEAPYWNERQELIGKALLAQNCESSYGHFTYFAADKAGLPVYLKPRVNRRDAFLVP